MASAASIQEVSFFELAARLEMARRKQGRWRDRRDTVPARRKRRRLHRRDFPASQVYEPAPVDPRLATRGVQSRLLGAAGLAALTVACVLAVIFAPGFSYDMVFLLTMGTGSLGLAIALIMGARREEIVHGIAHRLSDESGEPQRALRLDLRDLGEDGSLLLEGPEQVDPDTWSWELANPARGEQVLAERPTGQRPPYSPR
ncbi:hypothetical protein DV096_06065 [Bradymonadaceae bacterium TMQ3]|uniref:Uncharacterized protein n=1 Tax=Lujinxingia sediminis TaxID=2480984 RepID=A0ABY0CPX5_9DELT|nr:hypothetical protein [Lujinxingia sediminis]RDV38382.1 hypothetical protein DV096_06065 [Bradymonadaceae bacterium TMQ3]RVU42542.1 hypothetical protein EA187_15230 [Lujinxingia sediminis]TXC76847.1 hypothetical protein FRC91_08990 [Bradymonadales bacterium TMQ1]